MASIGTLTFLIKANASGVSLGMAAAGSALRGFGRLAGSVTRGVANTFQGMASAIVNPVKALSTLGWAVQGVQGLYQIGDILTKPIQMAASMEQTQLAFEVMLGSGEAAADMIQRIQEFAAYTPFETPELVAATREMIAFGVPADRVLNILRAIGDVTSISGGEMYKERFADVAHTFGVVASSGRLMTRQLNQFTLAGIDIMPQLRAMLGGVDNLTVRKMIEAGQVTYEHVALAFQNMVTQGGRFENGMARASQTIGGKWSTIMDNLKMSMIGIGQALIEGLGLSDWFDALIAQADAFRKNAKTWFQGLANELGEIFRAVRTLGVDGFNWLATTISGMAASQGFQDLKATLRAEGYPIDTLSEAFLSLGKLGAVTLGKMADMARQLAIVILTDVVPSMAQGTMMVVGLIAEMAGPLSKLFARIEQFKVVLAPFDLVGMAGSIYEQLPGSKPGEGPEALPAQKLIKDLAERARTAGEGLKGIPSLEERLRTEFDTLIANLHVPREKMVLNKPDTLAAAMALLPAPTLTDETMESLRAKLKRQKGEGEPQGPIFARALESGSAEAVSAINAWKREQEDESLNIQQDQLDQQIQMLEALQGIEESLGYFPDLNVVKFA